MVGFYSFSNVVLGRLIKELINKLSFEAPNSIRHCRGGSVTLPVILEQNHIAKGDHDYFPPENPKL